jgi:uncharacterized protein YprB with RNaseH-like and TPR domain
MVSRLYWQIKGESLPTLDDQLAQLRKRIAAIDAKYSDAVVPERKAAARRVFIEEWADGQVVENEFGPHYQTERIFEGHKPHGSADVGALIELPDTLLDALSGNEITGVHPERWAFLDTETTGLAGGSGTYAFLIGVGRITRTGFVVRQFFMREFAEERSQLAALDAHLKEFDVLITYNGKSYDQPLLETRYRMTRGRPPFARMRHLDLLHGARRLWKLRMESCRLTHLEHQILGVCREGDLPGHLIPFVYFEYLREKEATKLVPIFHHNAIDILTLACLTAIVPAAFRSTDCASLERVGVRRGEELAGIARWLMNAGEVEQALDVMKRAVDAGLPDRLLFRALWDISSLEKKLGQLAGSLRLLKELASCRNEFRICALEELAKYYERKEPNLPLALEFAERALELGSSDTLVRRCERLRRKISTRKHQEELAPAE